MPVGLVTDRVRQTCINNHEYPPGVVSLDLRCTMTLNFGMANNRLI